MKRIKKRVAQEGPCDVIHGNRGRPPAGAFPAEFKERVITLAQTRYRSFNFSHLSEMLEEEEAIRINRETVRIWLRPISGSGRNARRLCSAPMMRPGNRCSASSVNRRTWTAALRSARRSSPASDFPSASTSTGLLEFTTTRRRGVHVRQRDDQSTQFERAMEELAVRLIFADFPEARGRTERINETFQDRLVAELELRRVTTSAAVTEYLNRHVIPRYAKRFGVAPEEGTPAWRPVPSEADLRPVLCRRVERTVNKDNTVSVNGQVIQIHRTRTRLSFVKAKVVVTLWLDGSWHVLHDTHGELPCQALPSARPAKAKVRLKAGDQRESTHKGVT